MEGRFIKRLDRGREEQPERRIRRRIPAIPQIAFERWALIEELTPPDELAHRDRTGERDELLRVRIEENGAGIE
jgi:hypothetical protein